MKTKNIVYWVLIGLFILFAYFQWNDPDGLLWMGIYITIAITCAFVMMDRITKLPIKLMIGMLVLYLVVLVPDLYNAIVNYDPNMPLDESVTHTANVQTEVMKEVGGIVVSVLTLFYLHRQAK